MIEPFLFTHPNGYYISMFTLDLHHPSTFGYIIWIIKMETKQHGTNILVATMGRQA
jgi:hypothetical protein